MEQEFQPPQLNVPHGLHGVTAMEIFSKTLDNSWFLAVGFSYSGTAAMP